MKLSNLIFFSIFILVLNLNFVYSDDECCYIGTEVKNAGNGCDNSSEILLNNFFGTITNEAELCKNWLLDKKLYCIIENKCYEKVKSDKVEGVSYYIVNDSDVKESLKIERCEYLSNDCDGKTLVKDGTFPDSILDTSDLDSNHVDGTPSGSPDTDIDVTDDASNYNGGGTQEDYEACSNQGGQFGFFVNKSSCEYISDCVYNPDYRLSSIGVFPSFYDTKDKNIASIIGLSFSSFETACVYSGNFESCSDLKTKDLCENIPETITKITDNSCKWIEPNDFLIESNVLSNLNGFCISNSTNSDKDFSQNSYSERGGNLIINPSFENDFSNWINSSGASIINNPTYHGYNAVNLSINDSFIEQSISFPKNQYKIYLHILGDNFDEGDNLIIRITEINENIFKSYDYDLDLTSLNNGIYTLMKVDGDNSFPKNGDITTFSIKILSESSKPVIIDAISFSKDYIFEPVSIISSEVSNCNLCFEKNTLNTCTEEKSNFLGDCSYMVENISNSYEPQNSDPNKYFGKDENIFLNSIEKQWESQSIANSLLFCELYVHNNDTGGCEDENNYINKNYAVLHSFSENKKLCKWDENLGCYKDSNNDNSPDTRRFSSFTSFNFSSFPNIRLFSLFDYSSTVLYSTRFVTKSPSTNIFYDYNFEKEIGTISSVPNTLKSLINHENWRLSDFALACDVIPPVSYMYLVGKNLSNEDIIINNNELSDSMLGNVSIFIESKDFIPESCNNYFGDSETDRIKEKLFFIDYNINDKFGIKISGGSTIYKKNLIPFKDFFKDSGGDPLYSKTGSNNISIIIYDQSGNKGKEFSFNLSHLDLFGPKIELTSHSANIFDEENHITNTLGKNSILNFSISDTSTKNINCSFSFTSNSGLDGTYYNSTPVNFENSSNFNYLINLSDKYIHKTTSNGDHYDLDFSCTDVFGQKTSKKYLFLVDFFTKIILIKPENHMESNTRYIGGKTNLITYSSERNFSSCKLFFDTSKGFNETTTNLDISFHSGVNFDDGGFASPYNDPKSGPVFLNITGFLDFDHSGDKDGLISCTDLVGNNVKKNLSLYYDIEPPQLLNLTLINTDDFNDEPGVNSVYFDKENNVYYTIDEDVKFNLTFDGTYSPIFKITNITALDLNGDVLGNNSDVNISNSQPLDFNHNYSTFISNIELITKARYYSNNLISGESGELNWKNFRFNFTDLAGNYNAENKSYFVDKSRPEFVLGANIGNIDEDYYLYINETNPQFEFTFNTPNYRTFNCGVSVTVDRNAGYTPTSEEISFFNITRLSFSIEDILDRPYDFDKENEEKIISINLYCKDIYNLTLEEKLYPRFDNVDPILNSIYFENGNKKYLSAGDSFGIGNIIDKLEFNLSSTNEYGYTCSYQVNPSDVYNCNNIVQNITFDSILNSKTEDLPMLVGTEDFTEEDVICYRDDSNNPGNFFDSELSSRLALDDAVTTQITVNAFCKDKAMRSTSIKSVDLEIIYYNWDDIILSSEFEIRDDMVYPTIITRIETDLLISLFSNLENALLEIDKNQYVKFTDDSGGDGTGNELYKYQSNSLKFPLSEIDDFGEIKLYTLAYDSNNEDDIYNDIVSNTLYIDRSKPQANIELLGEIGNETYSDNFRIDFQGFDYDGGLDRLEIYLLEGSNYIPLYNSKTEVINSEYLFNSISSTLLTTNDDNWLEGSATFKDAQIGSTYDLELRVYDRSNNIGIDRISVLVKEGIGIILSNSENALVDPQTKAFWVTNSTSPILNFNITRQVSDKYGCAAKFKDSNYPSQSLNPTKSGEKKYSINTSIFSESFNLESLGENNILEISCIAQSEYEPYSYIFEVRLINSLPDYVLETDSFIVNEFPLEKDIVIRSVGAYEPVTCSYDINNENNWKDLPSISDIYFPLKQDFSNYDGEINFSLKCSNILGVEGPEKDYTFKVSKNELLQITNVSLSRAGFTSKSFVDTSKSKNEIIYIGNYSNWDLEFQLNKKENIECRYNIDSSGAIGSIIGFFDNLFGFGDKIISSTKNSYIYFSDNEKLSFSSFSSNSPQRDLIITCKNLKVEDEEIEKTYEVYFDGEATNITNVEISSQ